LLHHKRFSFSGTIVSDSGDTQRNFGLDYLRKTYANYKGNAVVYLADDDNSYDTRLFNKYIRKVRTIGIWAVGKFISRTI
jgi:hypothetical protein